MPDHIQYRLPLHTLSRISPHLISVLITSEHRHTCGIEIHRARYIFLMRMTVRQMLLPSSNSVGTHSG